MDNLANAFSSLQNSQIRRKKYIFLPFSKIVWSICTILYIEGFIRGLKKIEISKATKLPKNEISNEILEELGYSKNSQSSKRISNAIKTDNSLLSISLISKLPNEVGKDTYQLGKEESLDLKKNFRILVYLKYLNNKPILEKISKISLQGRRMYTKKTTTTLFSDIAYCNTKVANKVAHDMTSKDDKFSQAIEENKKVFDEKSKSKMITNRVGNIDRHSSSQSFRLKILSTSKGILSHKDARFLGIGGEILCEIF